MTNTDRPKFVAYRTASDEYEIWFYGGPLDGARIVTDVFPDSEKFVHHVHHRRYLYRYTQVAGGHFEARLDGFEPVQTRPSRKIRWPMRCLLVVMIATLIGLAVAVINFDVLSQ